MEKFPITKKQIIVIGLLVVSFFLLMDLNSRLNDLFRLSTQRDKMQAQVNSLSATKSSYETQIAFATSEAAVVPWAREQGGMALPGDIPIIPLSPQGGTPVPQVIPTPTLRVVQHYEKWWALFFGK